MGASSSKERVPAWAPPSLRSREVPRAYLELRHPNGSVAHVVGVKGLSASSVGEAKRVIRAAKPDSVLLELCDERVAPVWELLERGRTLADGSIVRLLPELELASFRSDARLRRPGFWLFWLEVEGYASLAGTTVGAAQAVAAAEAARFRAQTHLIDRRESVSTQRAVVAGLERVFSLSAAADEPAPGIPAEIPALFAKALDGDALSELRAEARSIVEAAETASPDEPVASLLPFAPWRAAAAAVVAERDEILAHRCWECLAALGPGGVAVAVVDARRLPGVRASFGTTTPDTVKAKLEPRDAPAVLAATAPLAASAGLAAAAVSYLPAAPRRLAFASLAFAPVLACGLAASHAATRYRAVRDLQLRLDDHR
mmetsp:Transcript_17042/g.53217  ORF Transcript_17042/g.53217 Transcript_17042/m.53217 type:complete len:372 (-) Transcript_17042:472-1587(-)